MDLLVFRWIWIRTDLSVLTNKHVLIYDGDDILQEMMYNKTDMLNV